MNVEVFCFDAVAPVRERGLKLLKNFLKVRQKQRRSREGAWIEIVDFEVDEKIANCRSREGAWIEIWHLAQKFDNLPVAPVRERGLKSRSKFNRSHGLKVAPVRERGLKCPLQKLIPTNILSRSREGAWIEIPSSNKVSYIIPSLP